MSDEWDDNEFPSAYLITIRTFGTWLHGDERGSVDRHGKNVYGTPKIAKTPEFESLMSENADRQSFLLDKESRRIVNSAIREVCINRGYSLYAINVRTNHVHVVISAQIKPEKVISTIKGYSTRKLRAVGSTGDQEKVWSRGGSRKYLWKDQEVERAMDYVLYGQGEVFWE